MRHPQRNNFLFTTGLKPSKMVWRKYTFADMQKIMLIYLEKIKDLKDFEIHTTYGTSSYPVRDALLMFLNDKCK